MPRNADRAAYAGEKDKPVKIEQRPSADEDDASGAPVDGPWTTLAVTEWMQRIDLNGLERFSAAQVSAPFDTIWKMGYRPDMDPDASGSNGNPQNIAKTRRLVFNGRVYDIVHARTINRLEGIEIQTLARQG